VDDDVAVINELLAAFKNPNEAIDFSKYGYAFAEAFDTSKIIDENLKASLESSRKAYLDTMGKGFKEVY
jgi:hypothetical protein